MTRIYNTLFLRPGPSEAKGHDKGNPSGEATDNAEGILYRNLKEALEHIKEKRIDEYNINHRQ